MTADTVLMPTKPTGEMIRAAKKVAEANEYYLQTIYRAFVAAAPTAPTPPPRLVPDRPSDAFRVVPVEPTPEMIEAAERREDEEPLSDWGKIVPAPHAEIYKAMLAAAPPAEAPAERGDLTIRRLLALRYSGAALYTDDGELQDNSTRPSIDFLRDDPAEIERKIHERGRASAAATGYSYFGDTQLASAPRVTGGRELTKGLMQRAIALFDHDRELALERGESHHAGQCAKDIAALQAATGGASE